MHLFSLYFTPLLGRRKAVGVDKNDKILDIFLYNLLMCVVCVCMAWYCICIDDGHEVITNYEYSHVAWW